MKVDHADNLAGNGAETGTASALYASASPREVRALMREHTPPLRLVQRGGQIDARAHDAEDERRGDLVANINILPQPDGGAHAPAWPQGMRRPIWLYCPPNTPRTLPNTPA